MTLDEIDRMLRNANPVTDPAALEGSAAADLGLDHPVGSEGRSHYRLHPLKGTDPVTTGDAAPRLDVVGGLDSDARSMNATLVGSGPPSTTETTRGRWWLVAASAAAVALIVVGIVAVVRDDHTSRAPFAPPTTAVITNAEGLGTSFVDAYGAFDATRATSYLSDDAELSMVDSPELLRRYLSLLQAKGFQLQWNACEQVGSSADGTRLRCPFAFDDLRSDEMGLGPYRGSYFDLTVRDDRIVRASKHWDVPEFSQQVWAPFLRWLQSEHPDDVLVMLDGSESKLSDRSIALWERRTLEYADYRTGVDVGLVGLPPVGAIPSSPQHGDLVDSYPVHGGGRPYEGQARLYADGRLIWYAYLDTSRGANTASTGYLEQHLTPEGVELVRTNKSLTEKDPIHLPGWLPASAWEDERIRAYIPSSYAVCLHVADLIDNLELAELLALLPAPAAELLRGRDTIPGYDDEQHCLVLPTEDARVLDAMLSGAGLEPHDEQYVLRYELDYPAEDAAWLDVVFEPRFPDGSIGCSSCG